MNRLAYLFGTHQLGQKEHSSQANPPEPTNNKSIGQPKERHGIRWAAEVFSVLFFSTAIPIETGKPYLLPTPIAVGGKLDYRFSQPKLPQYIEAWVDEQKGWNDPEKTAVDAMKTEIYSQLFGISVFFHWCDQLWVNSRGNLKQPLKAGLAQAAAGVHNTRLVLEDMLNAIHTHEMRTYLYLVRGYSPN